MISGVPLERYGELKIGVAKVHGVIRIGGTAKKIKKTVNSYKI